MFFSLLAGGVGFGLGSVFSRYFKKKKKVINQAELVKQEITCCLEGMNGHISQIIEQSRVEEDPFPHLIVENFLPEHVYKHACELWPDSAEFVGGKGAKRFILPVTYGCLEATNLPKNQRVFWRLFGEVIVNRYLKPKLAEKFKPYLHQKLGLSEHWHLFDPHRDTCNLRQDCLIYDQDIPNMPPHVDQLNMLAQIMIYFPSDNDHQDLGTIFYHGDPSTSPNDLYEVKKPENIQFAKKAPYKPNTLVVFIQSPTAWHGFERPATIDPHYKRRLYLSPLFFSPEFMERHYKQIYARSIIDEYFFDHRFLQKKNWLSVWDNED